MFEELSRNLVARFRLEEGYRVSCVGVELEEIEGAGSDLAEVVQSLEDDGYGFESALEEALGDRVVVSTAPKGYAFVRLEAQARRPVTVMVPSADLGL